MKWTIFFIIALISIGCSTPPCKQFLADYRYNPFIFPFPEYYYKADIIELNPELKINVKKENTTEIQFFDLKATLSGEWSNKETPFSGNRIAYKIQDKNNSQHSITIFNGTKWMVALCYDNPTDEKDYCSAYKSEIEYSEKLFTLTPDMENLTVGDLWIIHQKGMIFKDIKKIYIYKHKEFIAFRRDKDPNQQSKTDNKKTEIILYPYNTNNQYLYLTILTTFDDNDLILQLLQSIIKKDS